MLIDAADLRVADVVRLPDGEREIVKVDRDPDDPSRVRAWVRGQAETWAPKTEAEEIEGPPHALEWRRGTQLEIQRPGDLFPAEGESKPAPQPLPKKASEAFAFLRERLQREGWVYQGPSNVTTRSFLIDPTDTFRIELKAPVPGFESRTDGYYVGSWKERRWYFLWGELEPLFRQDAELGVQRILAVARDQAQVRAKVEAKQAARVDSSEPVRVVSSGPVTVRYSRDGGVLVCGDTFPHRERLKSVRKPYRLKSSRVLPGDCHWYAPKTRGTFQPRERVEALATALRSLGVKALVEYVDPVAAAAAGASPVAASDSASTSAVVDPSARIEALVDQSGVLTSRVPAIPELVEAIRVAEREQLGRDMRAYLVRAGKLTAGDGTRYLARVRSENALAAGTWPPEPDRGGVYSEDEFRGVLDGLRRAPEIAAILDAAKRWPEALEKVAGPAGKSYYADLDLERSIETAFVRLVGDHAAARRDRKRATAEAARSEIAQKLAEHGKSLTRSLDPRLYDPSTDPDWAAEQLCDLSVHVAGKVLDRVFGVPFPERRDLAVLCSRDTDVDRLHNKAVDHEIEAAERDWNAQLGFKADAEELLEILDGLGKDPTIRRFNLAYWRKFPTWGEHTRDEVRLRPRYFPGVRMQERIGPPGVSTDLWVRGPQKYGFTVKSTSGREAELLERLREEFKAIIAGRNLEIARDRLHAAKERPRRREKPLRTSAVLQRERELHKAADRIADEDPVLARALRGAASVMAADGHATVDKIESRADVELLEKELAAAGGEPEAAVFRGPTMTREALDELRRSPSNWRSTQNERERLGELLERTPGEGPIELAGQDLDDVLLLGAHLRDMPTDRAESGSFRAARLRHVKMERLGIVDTPSLRRALAEYVACCHPPDAKPKRGAAKPAVAARPTPAPTPAPTTSTSSDKAERRSEKLRAAADKLEADGKAALAQDRKTNTRKRMETTAHAIMKASRDVEIAQAMRRAAAVTDLQRHPYVARIESRQDVEYLEREFNQAIRNQTRAQGHSAEHLDYATPSEGAIAAAEYGLPVMTREGLQIVLQKAKSDRTTAAEREHVERLLARAGDKVELGDADLDALGSLVDKADKSGATTVLVRHLDTQRRRVKLGIRDTASLRAALLEYFRLCRAEVPAAKPDPIAAIRREIQLHPPPGYFPTPQALAERMVALAEIKPGMRVLEPSAGSGSIAAVIRDRHGDAKLDVIEKNVRLNELLGLQGFNVVGWDFGGHETEPRRYERIIMNPPFEANADTRHIARARAMLVPGGRLVAIASGSFPARSDAATTELREALVRANATIEPLAAGTFKESGTNASAVLIVVDEPLPVMRGVSAEHRAAVSSLTTVKAKWRDFLTEQQKRSPTGPWQPFGTTGCMQPIPGDPTLIVCVPGQHEPSSVGACPPLPGRPTEDRKLALCDEGQEVVWFGGADFKSAVRAEVENRIARRKSGRVPGPKPATLPAVDDFAGQAALLDSLVPTGIVAPADELSSAIEVYLVGPFARGKAGGLSSLSVKSDAEWLGESETLVAGVKVDRTRELGEFVEQLGTKWIPYTGPLSVGTLQTMAKWIGNGVRRETSLDQFRSGLFAGEVVYWVEDPTGHVIGGPRRLDEKPPGRAALDAFAQGRVAPLGIEVPPGQSLQDTIVVASVTNGKPSWWAWSPPERSYRFRLSTSAWGPSKPFVDSKGNDFDVPSALPSAVRQGLETAPRGTKARIAGPWLGRLFPTDFPADVVFEAPTGGALDLAELERALSEKMALASELPKSAVFAKEVTAAKQRLAWARKWLANQGRATKSKAAKDPGLRSLDAAEIAVASTSTSETSEPSEPTPVETKRERAARARKPPKPRAPKPAVAKPAAEPEPSPPAPMITPERAAIAAVAASPKAKPCTACAHGAGGKTSKLCTACAHATAPQETTPMPQTSKATSKKSSKKAGKKKTETTPPPVPSSSAPVKRGPGRPRKNPPTPEVVKAEPVPASKPAGDSSSRPRRALRRNDLVRFRKRSRIATDLRIELSKTFRVEYGLVIEGQRYVMIRLGKANAVLPVPEGQLVAVERADELPTELRACVAQLGRYKGKLRPQVRHFLRELQRRG